MINPQSHLLSTLTQNLQFLVGTSLVLLSTYLYTVPERKLIPGHRPPPIDIVSFEKPAITPLLTPKLPASPRMTDPTRLNLDPYDGRGMGLSSSRPSTPMLPRTSSRANLSRDD